MSGRLMLVGVSIVRVSAIIYLEECSYYSFCYYY